MSKAPLIALLTDFGSIDPYTGILKGVISQIAPGTPIVDLTHEVPPGDVLRAALALWQSRHFFPPETIFLCVVDPGVGTSRRAILLQSNSQTFIGPDNGIFSFVMDSGNKSWELTQPDYMLHNLSTTFHGRDVFAPAAAYAATGVACGAFGHEIDQLYKLPSPNLMITESGQIEGEVLYSDHFGNILTSLGRFLKNRSGAFILEPWLPFQSNSGRLQIYSPDHCHLRLPSGELLRWVYTFADLEKNECGFLVGSSGLIEIAANGTRADHILELLPRNPILLETQGK